MALDQTLYKALIADGLPPKAALRLAGVLGKLGEVATPAPEHELCFYRQQTYPTVARIVGNPTDVVVGGVDLSDTQAVIAAVIASNGSGTLARQDFNGEVRCSFDEAAACVVGDVAYWVSGYVFGIEAFVPAGLYGPSWFNANNSDYLPYILRYDLANDRWLPSVKIPAPAGAPIPPTDVPVGSEMGALQDETGTFGFSVYVHWDGGVIPDLSGITATTGGPFSGVHLFGHDEGNPQSATPLSGSLAAGDYLLYLACIGRTTEELAVPLAELPAGLHWDPARVTHTPGFDATDPHVTGWGFEAGYYGAIGTKVYFGGGDSNLYDDGSDGGAWDNGNGRQLMSYDTVTDEFETLAVKPNGHDYGWFGVADGKLFSQQRTSGNGDLDVYDPQTNSWTNYPLSIAVGSADWAQGVQVGRFLYWPDMGRKLDLDADPTTAEAWIVLPNITDPPEFTGNWDLDAAVAIGQDGKIHVFTSDSNAFGVHFVLDPADDTWSRDLDVTANRYYFSAVQKANGDWRFIGGDTDVQGTVHTEVDPVVTQHNDLDSVITRVSKLESASDAPAPLQLVVGGTQGVLSAGSAGRLDLVPGTTVEWNAAMPLWWFPAGQNFALRVDVPTFTHGSLTVEYVEVDVCSANGSERMVAGLDSPLTLESHSTVVIAMDDNAEVTGAGSDLSLTEGVIVSTAGGTFSTGAFIRVVVSDDFAA